MMKNLASSHVYFIPCLVLATYLFFYASVSVGYNFCCAARNLFPFIFRVLYLSFLFSLFYLSFK